MKVQLQGQALRLRINDAELAQLLAGATVSNLTHWPDGHVEHQRLALGKDHGWRRDSDGWQVTLDETEVRALAERLPSRDGLSLALSVLGGKTLHVLFDVDIRCSGRL